MPLITGDKDTFNLRSKLSENGKKSEILFQKVSEKMSKKIFFNSQKFF